MFPKAQSFHMITVFIGKACTRQVYSSYMWTGGHEVAFQEPKTVGDQLPLALVNGIYIRNSLLSRG